LQRHAATDSSGKTEQLLKSLYKDGLSISLDPQEVQRIRKLVTETGNSERGRDVFLRAEKSQCMKCHRVEGVGGSIGPDLNKISQTHTIEKIIESIVDPSREIKEGFETWTVVTTDGKVYGGLRISDGPPQFVLRATNGRDYRFYLDEIEEKFPSKRSLMPDETTSQLTLTEFVDLVAFLKDEQAQKTLPQYATQRSAEDRQ
jgi:putative heme-binding domain-containing protein